MVSKSLSEHISFMSVSMLAMKAILSASHLCEEVNSGRLRVVLKEWRLDVISRCIEQVNAEYVAWCALPIGCGIVCFSCMFDVSGFAASVLTHVLSIAKVRPQSLFAWQHLSPKWLRKVGQSLRLCVCHSCRRTGEDQLPGRPIAVIFLSGSSWWPRARSFRSVGISVHVVYNTTVRQLGIKTDNMIIGQVRIK